MIFTDRKSLSWTQSVIAEINVIIRASLSQRGECHIMLTGGRSAASLYSDWEKSIQDSAAFKNVHFYFGDERCVSPGHPESNFRLAAERLFPRGLPDGAFMHKMEGDTQDHELAADRYAAILPEHIDLLLLSIGEDGHIASLFPHSTALQENNKRVVPIFGPKPPYQRLTITPPVIRNARNVMVMALGQQKRAVFEMAQVNPSDIDTLPARMLLDRIWIFGEQ